MNPYQKEKQNENVFDQSLFEEFQGNILEAPENTNKQKIPQDPLILGYKIASVFFVISVIVSGIFFFDAYIKRIPSDHIIFTYAPFGGFLCERINNNIEIPGFPSSSCVDLTTLHGKIQQQESELREKILTPQVSITNMLATQSINTNSKIVHFIQENQPENRIKYQNILEIIDASIEKAQKQSNGSAQIECKNILIKQTNISLQCTFFGDAYESLSGMTANQAASSLLSLLVEHPSVSFKQVPNILETSFVDSLTTTTVLSFEFQYAAPRISSLK